MYLGGEGVIYFVVEEVTALLAQGNELPYLIVFFLDGQRQEILPKSNADCHLRGRMRAPRITNHLPAKSADTDTQVT
jgi:hypothetical protein